MWPNPLTIADLVLFTEETLNGKLQFLYSEHSVQIFRWKGGYKKAPINKQETTGTQTITLKTQNLFMANLHLS